MTVSDRTNMPAQSPALQAAMPRVLLIEDDAQDAERIFELLRAGWAADVELLHVGGIDAACAYLAEHPVAFALMDLTLPGVDRLDALQRLRAVAPAMPVIALSEESDEMAGPSAVAAGARDYVRKGRAGDHLASRASRTREVPESLTELPGRAMFEAHVEDALERSRHTGERVAVLVLELDSPVALDERLMSLVGMRLRTASREIDTIARLGGHAFAILCEAILGEPDAAAVGDRLAQAVAVPFAIGGAEVRLTATVGRALGAGDRGAGAESLVHEAEAAMRRERDYAARRLAVLGGGPGPRRTA